MLFSIVAPLIWSMHEYMVYGTMQYYSAIKENEIMPFAATWMDLKIIIPINSVGGFPFLHTSSSIYYL